jgi:hypothetical protein
MLYLIVSTVAVAGPLLAGEKNEAAKSKHHIEHLDGLAALQRAQEAAAKHPAAFGKAKRLFAKYGFSLTDHASALTVRDGEGKEGMVILHTATGSHAAWWQGVAVFQGEGHPDSLLLLQVDLSDPSDPGVIHSVALTDDAASVTGGRMQSQTDEYLVPNTCYGNATCRGVQHLAAVFMEGMWWLTGDATACELVLDGTCLSKATAAGAVSCLVLVEDPPAYATCVALAAASGVIACTNCVP